MANTESNPLVPGGIYQHFKGNYYLLKEVTTHAEGIVQLRVVYMQLYAPYKLCSRTAENFSEHVEKPEYGYRGPRFRFIREGLNNVEPTFLT